MMQKKGQFLYNTIAKEIIDKEKQKGIEVKHEK